MQLPPWILCLWPGLPQLWVRGTFSALSVAVLFAGLLQGMMLTSFVWPGLAPDGARTVGWLTIGTAWLVGAWVSYRRLPALAGPGRSDWRDALFCEAQTEYLRGNWYQAQVLLEQLLREDASDAAAGLMLASLYRHVGRINQARAQLRQLQRSGRSGKWSWEIQREHEHLDRVEPAGQTAPASEAEPAATPRAAAAGKAA